MLRSVCIATMFACFAGHLLAAEPARPQKASDSPTESVGDDLHEGWFTAMVHVRYHQEMAARYESYSLWSKLLSLLISGIAIFGPLVWRRIATQTQEDKYEAISLGLSAGAFMVSIVLLLFPFDTWYRDHAVATKEWGRLAAEWKAAQGSHRHDADIEKTVDRLKTQQMAIEQSEPIGPDEKLLAQAFDAQSNAIGVRPGS